MHGVYTKPVTVILVISLVSLSLQACGASPQCCACVYENHCVREDNGACYGEAPCSTDESPDLDNDDTGLIGLFYLLALIICHSANHPEMTVSASCAVDHDCDEICADDEYYIDYE